MDIGFTGTREGMTAEQLAAVKEILGHCKLDRAEFHHGDCVGADEQAATAAQERWFTTVAHPPTDERLRAFHNSTIVLPSKPYHARNRDIVEACLMLIACPKERHRGDSGGTWWTVGYAEGYERDVRIVWPDGTIESPGPLRRG